jgi:hypothetical protein
MGPRGCSGRKIRCWLRDGAGWLGYSSPAPKPPRRWNSSAKSSLRWRGHLAAGPLPRITNALPALEFPLTSSVEVVLSRPAAGEGRPPSSCLSHLPLSWRLDKTQCQSCPTPPNYERELGGISSNIRTLGPGEGGAPSMADFREVRRRPTSGPRARGVPIAASPNFATTKTYIGRAERIPKTGRDSALYL